jgi:glycosyltransferase involved in cell wall biosynthesis
MRILHVTQAYGGGLSRAIEQIVALTPQHEHFLLGKGVEIDSAGQGGFRAVRLLPANHLEAMRNLIATAGELMPDVVHAHSSWAGMYARAVKLPIPVVYEPHCYAFEMEGVVKRIAYFSAEWLLARRLATVVVLSEHESKLARKLSHSGRQVYLPNVPSLPIVVQEAGHKRDRSVVMVGRLCQQKDPAYFAELAHIVHGLDPTIDFRWIGDGDAAHRATLLHAGVVVTGWLNGTELASELSTAGCYVHTARYEGFPLSVLDAAAQRVPILARAIPAFDGSRLRQVRTIQQMAIEIVQVMDSGEFVAQLQILNDALLSEMNADRQVAALADLYSGTRAELPIGAVDVVSSVKGLIS